LLQTNLRITRQIDRQPAMQWISIFLCILVTLLSVLVIWRRDSILGWAEWAALTPAAIMLAVLWQPAVVDSGLVGAVLTIAGLVAVFLAAGRLVLRSPFRALAWMSGMLVLTVLFDLARGSFLVRDSIMSYTPVEGARYYGIGNYQFGCALGAAMIASGFVASALSGARMLRMAVLGAALLALVAAIGLPSLGADAGGGMSGGAAVVAGLILWRDREISRRFIVYAILAIPASLGLMIVLDVIRSGGAQSHIGRAMELISSGGAVEIWKIIERKMGVNIRLLTSSPWGKLLAVSVISAIAMLGMRHGEGLRKLRTDRHVYSAVIAAAIGITAAFLLNDSGTVAAATAFIYVWMLVVIAVVVPATKGNFIPGR